MSVLSEVTGLGFCFSSRPTPDEVPICALALCCDGLPEMCNSTKSSSHRAKPVALLQRHAETFIELDLQNFRTLFRVMSILATACTALVNRAQISDLAQNSFCINQIDIALRLAIIFCQIGWHKCFDTESLLLFGFTFTQ